MKLYLHWLRWDLHRFRWPLLAWTVMLGAFMLWLWYANAHLLTLDIRLLDYNGVAAGLLFIAEIFILLRILSSDPATGAHAFWKTRPPSGFAVAGARLSITAFFFLALPLLSWWAVECSMGSAPPAYWNVRLHIDPVSWLEYLWWMQALIVSVLFIATAAALSAGHAFMRALAGAGVLLLLTLAVFLAMGYRGTTPPQWLQAAAWKLTSGNTGMVAPAVWLTITGAFFIHVRRTRTPARSSQFAHLVYPLVALAAGACLAPPLDRPTDPPRPALRHELVSALRVGEPMLRDGISASTEDNVSMDGTVRTTHGFSLRLGLSGLPAEHTALAGWRELTLTAPDGTTRTLQTTGTLDWILSNPNRADILTVVPTSLHKPEDVVFSLAPCRAEGVLSVEVRRKHRAAMPLRAGIMDLPHARIRLSEMAPVSGQDFQPWFEIRRQMESFNAYTSVWLENRADPRLHLGLENRESSSGVGWFILHAWSRNTVSPSSSAISRETRARLARDMEAGKLDDWQLVTTWHESEGWVEIPVTLEQVTIPRLPGDERGAAEIFEALRMEPGADKDQVRRIVRHALRLINLSGTGHTVWPLETDPLVQAAGRFLTSVRREHLDVLFRIAEDEPAEEPDQVSLPDFALRRRIMELLTGEDIPLLRTRPALVRYLCYDLAERNFIPDGEPYSVELNSIVDDELRRRWESNARTRLTSITSLQHAARRGLSWVPSAVAEIVQIQPWSGNTIALASFLSGFSDCPADYKSAIPWLQQNAARLTWNAAAKRWVLPPP